MAAVLPSSSDAGAKRIKRAVTSKNTAWEQLQTMLMHKGKAAGIGAGVWGQLQTEREFGGEQQDN